MLNYFFLFMGYVNTTEKKNLLTSLIKWMCFISDVVCVTCGWLNC